MTNNKSYSTGQVAKLISVEPVTVRKYAQMLEDKGYSFEKDNKGWRCFKETDLNALKHLSTLRNKGLSVEESLNKIMELYRYNLSILPTDIPIQEEESALLIFMKRQEDFNKKILEKMEDQEQRQAERDNHLMLVLREVQETKKQIATAKQKKWWEFWR